ncbi:EscU/YscU/HrcU family type III secretion system export apparatus switch protein [Sandarakinorhabdus rubra]|uniref:EscU/YscU/HrcU family type III secretion system export apparatus switch protein n=1 Tax=Sandarakinorhabdus rubra TaxID=2672568 RepID=UPI0013DBC6B0|nr:EscU/YscU/HrcU family type III secretion system export apparatus switch protein [Sandarakinorhabdus rubra]
MAGEKTEKPTPRRREKALEEGNVFAPRELAPAASFAVATLFLVTAGPMLWHDLASFLAGSLAGAAGGDVRALARRLPVAAPLLLLAMVAVVAIGLQLAVTRHAGLGLAAPKWSRISPLNGLKRLFGWQGLAGAATALLKLGGMAALGLAIVLPALPTIAAIEEGGLAAVGALLVRLAVASTLLLALVALVDAGFTWWRRERQLMMTREEVKRESRESDGAPELRAAVRRAQMAAAQGRMRKSLADAAVVVVNPVHFAVALRYRAGTDEAPVVVEKGRLDMAHALIAAARELKVPIIRTPRLARALFWSAKAGQMVRPELFPAVATILAFVMRFDDPEAEAVPDVFVPPALDVDEHGKPRKAGAPLPL